MLFRPLFPALATLLLAAGLAAQPCIKVGASSHWGEPLVSTQFLRTNFAIRVPGLAQNDTICQIELFCYTRSAQPVSMPVWIYDRAPSGAPGSPLSAGTMTVGTTAAAYTASVQAPVQANTDFFIVFDNAVGNLAPPTAGRASYGGSAEEHWHGGPPSWAGPYYTGKYIYRLYCSSGTVEGLFSTVGQGCSGTLGVPRIGSFGSPVIGQVFQVTLAQAPNAASVVHFIGGAANPISLAPIGAEGCVLEQAPLVAIGMRAGSTGSASFPYRLPNDPTLLAVRLHMQWAVVDPSANLLGIVVSPGGVATIGDF